MNIGTIGGVDTVLPPVAASTVGVTAVAARPSTPPSTATISAASDLLSRLDQLSRTNPPQFAAIVASGANALSTAADGETDGNAYTLRVLSHGFAQAAGTGNVGAIDPSLFGTSGTSSAAGRHRSVHHAVARIAPLNGSTASGADAAMQAVSDQVDAALGLSTAPLGPWFPR